MAAPGPPRERCKMSNDTLTLELLNEPVITAGMVNNKLGVTYSQIKFWESKGLIESSRKSKHSWRRYSACDLLVLAIIKKIRDLSIGLRGNIEGLRHYTQSDLCVFAILAHVHGDNVYLITNLQDRWRIINDGKIRYTVRTWTDRKDRGLLVIPLATEIELILQMTQLSCHRLRRGEP